MSWRPGSSAAQINDIVNYNTTAAVTNVYTLDLAQNKNFTIETLDVIAKTISFVNVPANANFILSVSVRLKYTNAAAITFPSGITWKDGVIPTFTVGKQYLLCCISYDAGVSWLASSVGAW